MSATLLSPSQAQQYRADGYVILKGLFDRDECELMLDAVTRDAARENETLARNDGEGGVTRLRLYNTPGDDVLGLVGRLPRLVETATALLEGEVYLYHAKATLKEPFTGGAWAWHQDYGYWYHNGCLFPYMTSCMIALDPSTRENGCLQVLVGSHHLGRLDHGKVGDQTGADPDRVQEAAKVLPLVYCELDQGDAVFFHCNTLHRSDQNRSPNPRRAFICCYNAARNNPYKEHHHPRYYKMELVPDTALKDLQATAR